MNAWDWQKVIMELRKKEEILTPFEKNFLDSIKSKDNLSSNECSVLSDIYYERVVNSFG